MGNIKDEIKSRLIFIPRWLNLLYYFQEGYSLSDLGKKSDTTQAYMYKLITALEHQKIVTTKIKGRRRIITLTKKGELLRDHVCGICYILK